MINLKRVERQFDLVGAGYNPPTFIAAWQEPTETQDDNGKVIPGPSVVVALTPHGERWYLLTSSDGSGLYWASFQSTMHPNFIVCKGV